MQFFGTTKLEPVDDWIPIVSQKNWQPEHSAYELAHSWQPAGGFPVRVADVLASSDSPMLAGIRPLYGVVEKPVFLDTLKAPSWTDVMVYCSNADGDSLVIAVEGKAKESFGPIVSDWIRAKGERGESVQPKPTRLNRLEYLSQHLSVRLSLESHLRYQLAHRTVSAISECELHTAAAAMVLVHSFIEAEDENWRDYVGFVEVLGVTAPQKDVVQGPVQLGPSGETPVFFVWVSDEPSGRAV